MKDGNEIGLTVQGRESAGGTCTMWFRVHGHAELGPVVLNRAQTEALSELIDALTELLSEAVESSGCATAVVSLPPPAVPCRPSGVHPARVLPHDE